MPKYIGSGIVIGEKDVVGMVDDGGCGCPEVSSLPFVQIRAIIKTTASW